MRIKDLNQLGKIGQGAGKAIYLVNHNDLNAFKTAFGRNYELVSKKFTTAIAEIDKSISHLQKTKEAFLSTDRNLRLTNEKAQDVSVKRLTRKKPNFGGKV
jgi:hypothetical protein